MNRTVLDQILYLKATDYWNEIQSADSEEEILDILADLIFWANDYNTVVYNEGENGESFQEELKQLQDKE